MYPIRETKARNYFILNLQRLVLAFRCAISCSLVNELTKMEERSKTTLTSAKPYDSQKNETNYDKSFQLQISIS